MKGLLAILSFILSIEASAFASTYYVSPGGHGDTPSDSNTKTQAQVITTPWRTISFAVTQVVCGDTLLIRGGSYTTEPGIQFTQSGCTSSSQITVQNYQTESPVITWPDTTTDATKNFLFCAGASCTSTISWINLIGIEAVSGFDGIKIYLGNNLTFRRMNIHGTSQNGFLGGCTNCTIDRSAFWSNGNYLQAQCSNDPNCNQLHGMYLVSGTGWVITNNLIYNNLAYGIQLDGVSIFSGTIANNTIAYQKNRGAIVFWQTINSTTVENNILYENCTNTSICSSQAGGIAWSNYAGTGNQALNNIFYATSPHAPVFIDTRITSGLTTSGNCSVANGPCGVKPLMVNAPSTFPVSPDFHLSAGSNAIDFGLNLSALFTTDFDGVTRTVPWDVGAYQFVGGIVPAAPTGLQIE